MNPVKLKVCGMRDPENILQVAELRPDYMGFIFYGKSKRFVGDDFDIPPRLNGDIKRVGVFVNETTAKMEDLATKHRLELIQLHGNESVEQCLELKESGRKVIKVFSIDNKFQFGQTKPFRQVADYFLFDTKSETYGGTGKSFDWKLLERYDQEVPFFLSGGLSSTNVKDVKNLSGMNLHALDVNSGVELSPGLKDIEKIGQLQEILNSNF